MIIIMLSFGSFLHPPPPFGIWNPNQRQLCMKSGNLCTSISGDILITNWSDHFHNPLKLEFSHSIRVDYFWIVCAEICTNYGRLCTIIFGDIPNTNLRIVETTCISMLEFSHSDWINHFRIQQWKHLWTNKCWDHSNNVQKV